MPASAGTVTLNLDANSVKLLRELQKSKRATKKTAMSMRQSMAKTFASMKAGAKVAGAAMALAAAAAARLTANSLKSADAIGKQADKLGMATEALAGMQLAAEITGSTQEALVKGLTKMQKAIVDGAAGMTTYTRAFDALNLSARDLIKLSPDEQFKKIAGALKNVATHTEKVAAFADIFGARNSLLLNLNVEALERYTAEADRLGLSMSRWEVKKIEDANDALLVGKRALTGIGNSMAIAVAPLLKVLAEKFSTIAGETKGFRQETHDLFRTAVGGAGSMVDSLRRVQSTWDGIKVAALGALAVWQQAGVWGAKWAVDDAWADFQISRGGEEERAALDAARQRRQEEEIALAETITSIESSKQRIIDAANAPAKFREMFLAAFDSAELLEPVVEFSAGLSTELTAVETAMSALGIDTTDQLQAMSDGFVKSTRRVEENHEALKKVLDVLLELGEGAGGISLDTYNRRLEESFATLTDGLEEIEVEVLQRTTEFANAAFDEMAEYTKQAARNMQDAMADFFFDPFEDGLKGMVKSFANAVRRMLANQMALQVFSWFSGFGGASGRASSAGTDAGNVLTEMFPPRAAGGPVSAGKAFLVGERGPEVFVPNMSGQVIPNGFGGGNTYNIDARGADAERILRELPPLLEETENRAVARTQQLSREGRAA